MSTSAEPLALSWAGRRRLVPPGTNLVIGRQENADLQIVHPEVSREHLLVRHTTRGWELSDRSTNGTFVDGQRVTHMRIQAPVTITLGTARGAPELRLEVGGEPGTCRSDVSATARAESRAAAQGRFSAAHQLATCALQRVRIGREDDNDVVLAADLLVSRNHAELVLRPGQRWELVDLDSSNGSFVNGQRIRRAFIGADDVVGIGHSLLHLDGDRLVQYTDAGEVPFRAVDLVVRENNAQLLDHVGFSLEQRSMLGVVGPSGAGKSTLLRALTGARPADEGTVEYADRDMYADYDELRQRIGLVPQDDILHPQLTVRRALSFAAQLRFPIDVSSEERDRRIDEVLTELDLVDRADHRIEKLSGGQRKRVSVALELLTRPTLLFLDEPTTGLDPGLDKSVMRTLRGLADEGPGRTIVVVTHSVAHLELCDRLLLLSPPPRDPATGHDRGTGGQMAFFGPPQEALAYFGVRDYADLFITLSSHPEIDWGARFRASTAWKRYVERRPAQAPPQRPFGTANQSTVTLPAPAPPRQPVLNQFSVLCRRYVSVILADVHYTIFMATLPVVLSLLAHALPGATGLSQAAQSRGEAGSPNSLLLILVVGAALMGSAAAIREIVKERQIYARERAIGLSRRAYLASKLTVLGAVTGLQAVLLGILGNLGRPAPDDAVLLGSGTVEIVVALVGVTVASMVLGLAVSAAISNADRGMPLLVLMAMLQFILSSALLQIGSSPVLGQLAWFVPARWGFALGASTVGIPSGPGPMPTPYRDVDSLWSHDSATWLGNLTALGVLATGLALLTAVLLRRGESRRRRRARWLSCR